MKNVSYAFRRGWLSALLLLCLATSMVGCSRAARKDRHLARGQEFFKAEQFDKAEIEFLNVLRLERTNTSALRHLALGYYYQGRLPLAVAHLQKSVELAPADTEVRLRLAGLMVASRKLNEARRHADVILASDPANDEALMILSDTVASANEFDEVRQRIESFRSQAGNKPGFHLALGTLHLRQQQTNEALAEFQRALSLDNRSSPAHLALGNLFAFSKDMTNAEAHFKTAAELAPLRSMRRVQYADFKLRTGDLTGAKTFLESIAQQAPDYLPPYTRLAEIAFAEHRFDDAVSFSKKILARDPGNYDAMLLLGRVRIAKGEPSQAVTEFERLVAAYPRVPAAHYQLATAQLMNKSQSKAIASLNQSLALDPRYVQSILLLAELNIRKNDLLPAIFSLKQLVREQPQIAEAHLLLANAHRARKELDAAEAVYENMAKLFPRNPQPYFLWGQVLLLEKKTADARTRFQRAIELSPDFLPALEELVDLDIAEKNFSTAEKRVQAQIDKNPKAPALLLFLAKIFSAQAEYKKAEDTLSRAIALDAGYQPAYLALARVFVASKNHTEAIAKLNAVLEKSPTDVTALMLRGMIQTELKDYPAAAESYEKLLTVNPRFIPALNNLAWLYSEHLNRFDKAYAMARSARDLQPFNPLVADTFGWILFKRGEYPWALSLLQESADKLPKTPEVAFHLAMTHYMLGEELAARRAFERALESPGDFPGKTEALQRLQFLSTSAETNAIAPLEQQLASNPRDPILLARLATLYEQSGAFDKAGKAYNQTLESNPGNISAMLKLAQLYAGPLRDPSKAMQLAKDAHALAPDDPHVSHVLGRLAFDAADYKWSLSLLQESARKITTDPNLLYDLAWAWYSLGRVSEADATMKQAVAAGDSFNKFADARLFVEMNAFYLRDSKAQNVTSQVTTILEKEPRYIPALFAHGIVQENSGDNIAARDRYHEVLKQFPSFAPAQKRLAILLAKSPSDSSAAYQYALKAREAFPEDPEVARVLGMLAYRRQEYSRAAQLLEECSRKLTNDSETFYYLGMAHFHLKQRNESRRALQQAVSLNATADFVPDARRILGQLN